MAKILELDLENEERLCALGSALSSPARIQILKLLSPPPVRRYISVLWKQPV